MINKIFSTVLLSFLILFSGCNNTEGESKLSTQQMLDQGNYDGVILKLEGNADDENDYMALGAAYMGKAGSTLPLLFTAMSEDDDVKIDNDFANFVRNITQSTSPSGIEDLNKAIEYYKLVSGDICSSINPDRTDSQKDVCLFIGLGYAAKTAIAVGLLVNDVSNLTKSTIKDDKLQASICAMEYAYHNSYSKQQCSIITGTDLSFESLNDKEYKPLSVRVNSTNYYYLMSENKIVLSNGFCKVDDFESRVYEYNDESDFHSCPLSENPDEDITVFSVLVEGLNEGFASISSALSTDIQEDINEYRREISSTQDGIVTEENIIKYLDEQNGE